MKKLILVIAVATLFLAGCGGGSESLPEKQGRLMKEAARICSAKGKRVAYLNFDQTGDLDEVRCGR